LRINIEGKTYEQLCLRIGLDDGTLCAFDGKSENNQDWTFLYPDSVYEKMKYKFLFVKEPDSISHRLAFSAISNKDTLGFGEFSFKKRASVINLRYMKTIIVEKSFQTNNKTFIQDIFFVNAPVDPQLLAVGKCMTSNYSMFAYDSLTNDQRFEKYISLTKEFPYSEYAIAMLSQTLTRYQSKEDVQKIFSCFNKEVQNSYFGKKISAYIAEKTFKNSVLPSWNNGVSESIVKDTTKFTLVLFSASWCAPCHEQIPILKDIYKDQSGKLDMVYISMDEPETVENWKKMMREEPIPWRSLLAVDNTMKIKERYYVQGIPYSILVYPDGHMEDINVRQKNSLDKLYKILK
jgi:thiol-disulfide isomerase/thioredoxin